MAKMKWDKKLENLVVSVSIDQKINLEQFAKKAKDIEYDPDHFPGAIYRMKEPRVSALIFSSGKVNCTGARHWDEIPVIVKCLEKKFKEGGLRPKKVESKVQNLVVSAAPLGGTDPTQFARTNNCGTVAPSGTCTITVRFNPTTVGDKSATVSIAHNAAGSPSVVTLTGAGSIPTGPIIALPADTAFGTRQVGTTSTKSITVSNLGPGPLTVTSVTVDGPFAVNPFTVNLGTCAGAQVAAGRSCRLSATFTPITTAGGPFIGNLTVVSNAQSSPPSTLSGDRK